MPVTPLHHIQSAIDAAARARGHAPATLLAVSKTQSAAAVAALASQGQHRFGENYVQEAAAKIAELRPLELEWHLIGHLQSNKAEQAATLFDWVQTLDRPKLVCALARYRAAARAPLNVLIQVNIDDEASKHGCTPAQISTLAAQIATEPRLMLRGLMAIPAPHPELARRREAFRHMRVLFEALAVQHPQIDTLSMGMSGDFAEAIAEGATMVRVGTALFGPRPQRDPG